MDARNITTQEKIKAANERKIHRIRGLLIKMGGRLDEMEGRADGLGWGDFGALHSLESYIAYYLANQIHPSIFSVDEDKAVDLILADVDPEGEAHVHL